MLVRGWAVLICGLVIVFMPSQTSSEDNDLGSNWKNADFVITDFSVFLRNYSVFDDSKKTEVSSEDRNEMQAWYLALRKASAFLPIDFAKEIATDLDDDDCLWGRNVVSVAHHESQCVPKWIKFKFFIDSTFWGTAYPDRINLRPSVIDLPDWLTWEPFPKDGYSEEELIWIALHEFAHRYRQVSGRNFVFITDSPTTFYGCAMGQEETFADTFALYVMFPDRLTQFSLVYDEVKGILGREYQTQFQMPNSVASKLTNLKDGCKRYDEDVARIRANHGVVSWDIR